MIPIRALTPTGKAADRLKDLGVDAMTIHRALASAGWYDWELGVWVEGDDRVVADTLIIDECSMVDVELLATLARAVDWQGVRRLVLVGDHHQLPPIGPGRPFFDVIAVMQSADDGHEPRKGYKDRLSELTHNYRVDAGSYAIAFANSFAQTAEPDDALVWEAVAQERDLGDLRIRYWEDPEDLHESCSRRSTPSLAASAIRPGSISKAGRHSTPRSGTAMTRRMDLLTGKSWRP